MIKNAKDIRSNHNCYEIIKGFVDLVKKGNDYKGLCPFHTEKSPSFSVSPSRNIYTCFGCGATGDGVSFLMDHEDMTYPEAIEHIAKQGGSIIEYDNSINAVVEQKKNLEQKKENESLYILNQLVADIFYTNGLEQYKRTKDKKDKFAPQIVNLWGRTYSDKVIQEFKIGYAPKGNKITNKTVNDVEWSKEQLEKVGLIRTTESNEFDFFQDRMIFPIYSHRNKIVGFSGRVKKVAKEKKIPKYINSPETPIYIKKNVLYGLYQNKRHIAKEGFAYLVEGYTDVLTMVDYGIPNVVAKCGTALTKEQCYLLKRFTNTVVVVPDNDENNAGRKAARTNIDMLVQCGLFVRVLDIPDDKDTKEKYDPDSFLRAKSLKGFRGLEQLVEDGIVWRINQEQPQKSYDNLDICIQLSARLLSKIKNVTIRDQIADQLTHKSILSIKKRDLQEAIAKVESNKSKSDRKKLKSKQTLDANRYGVFVGEGKQGNRYYRKADDNDIAISNFVITPLFHIKSRENPARLIEIKNEHGHAYVIEAHTDVFITQAKFESLVAAHGNFRLESTCRGADFKRIVSKMYDEMDTVYRISTLGYHKKGFYVWGSGITIDGKYYPASVNGIVEFRGQKYILPGKSFSNENDDSYDDDTTVDKHIKLFRYFGDNCISFYDWHTKFIKVFGKNGLMGSAFYLASLYRDIMYDKNNFFPLLNLFGPPQKGKSTMAWSLSSMFGIARKPLLLSNFTLPGFVGRGQQVRNGLMWVDEYKSHLDKWIDDVLKGTYDGTGREKRDMSTSKSTSSDEILSALLITGQDMPLNDIALFTRCISLICEFERTPKSAERLKDLRDIEQTGQLSHITSQLQKHRSIVDTQFDITLSDIKSSVLKELGSEDVTERTLNNHCYPLTVVKILEPHLKFADHFAGISYYEILERFTIDLIRNQSQVIYSQDDVGEFWSQFQYFILQKMIKHSIDFVVENKPHVSVIVKRGETTRIDFKAPKKILFLRFTRTFQEYSKHSTQLRKQVLNERSLKAYLTQSKAYIGDIKSKRLNSTTNVRVTAFDMNLLPFDLPLSVHADDVMSVPATDTNCSQCSKILKDCECDKCLGCKEIINECTCH